jgi:osmotically-inducible protein OsmY
MNKDEEIRLEVTKEIKSERRITNSDRIQVNVKGGVVTLSGYVEHYMDQIAAVAAVERVTGVEGVVQEIEVVLPEASRRDDEELARSACAAIEHNSTIPQNHVKVSVCDGLVTLEGELEEEHQRDEAENTVSRILGVKGVTNKIVVKHHVKPFDVTLQIERAFQHMAVHHAREIHVEVKNDKVVLSGVVRAWIEKAEAEEAAHEIQGVTEVENRLELTPLLEGKEKPPPTT